MKAVMSPLSDREHKKLNKQGLNLIICQGTVAKHLWLGKVMHACYKLSLVPWARIKLLFA